MSNEGKATNFEENICLFGRIFGEVNGINKKKNSLLFFLIVLIGEIEYEIYEAENSKH